MPSGRSKLAVPKPPSSFPPRKNAVKYVDYALGRFVEQAKQEEFWKDTIIVVVADHGARVYGSQTIPIRSYQIPFLVLGPAAVQKPERNKTLGCQLDVAPTILGLIGRPYDTVFYGHDLRTVSAGEERVLLHHNRSVGIARDDRLVAFSLNKVVEGFATDVESGKLEKLPELDPPSQALTDEATALFQTADDLYTQRRYHVVP